MNKRKTKLQLLKEANSILRSFHAIIQRKGKTTHWDGIADVVQKALDEQHELLLAKNAYKRDLTITQTEEFLYGRLTRTGEMPNGDAIYLITQKSVDKIIELIDAKTSFAEEYLDAPINNSVTITELKIGDKVELEGYDEAWIGWVTNSSYLIHKIKNRFDEKGKISLAWLLKNMESCWVSKREWHSKN